MPNMTPYPQKARDRIAGSKIIDRLVKHVNGEIEMTATQVRAASILLDKVLPNLKSTELQATLEVGPPIDKLTDEQLLKIASGGVVYLPAVNKKPIIEMPAIEPSEEKTG